MICPREQAERCRDAECLHHGHQHRKAWLHAEVFRLSSVARKGAQEPYRAKHNLALDVPTTLGHTGSKRCIVKWLCARSSSLSSG